MTPTEIELILVITRMVPKHILPNDVQFPFDKCRLPPSYLITIQGFILTEPKFGVEKMDNPNWKDSVCFSELELTPIVAGNEIPR